MDDRAAIKATFVDLRPVKTRSQVQLIFEIPVEQADTALEVLGGYPQPQEGKWVAIARINETAARAEPEKPKRAPATTRAEKARRLCGVVQFQHFMTEFWPTAEIPEGLMPYEATSWCVKTWCRVKSKSELDTDPDAKVIWDRLLSEYEQQAGRMAERH